MRPSDGCVICPTCKKWHAKTWWCSDCDAFGCEADIAEHEKTCSKRLEQDARIEAARHQEQESKGSMAAMCQCQQWKDAVWKGSDWEDYGDCLHWDSGKVVCGSGVSPFEFCPWCGQRLVYNEVTNVNQKQETRK